VLNVAVGISAGVAALVSAVPALHPHMLSLSLAILAFVTIMNLRRTLDAGRVFAIPTYLFVASYSAILVLGVRASHVDRHRRRPRLPARVHRLCRARARRLRSQLLRHCGARLTIPWYLDESRV
jgi:hypothetical protein